VPLIFGHHDALQRSFFNASVQWTTKQLLVLLIVKGLIDLRYLEGRSLRIFCWIYHCTLLMVILRRIWSENFCLGLGTALLSNRISCWWMFCLAIFDMLLTKSHSAYCIFISSTIQSHLSWLWWKWALRSYLIFRRTEMDGSLTWRRKILARFSQSFLMKLQGINMHFKSLYLSRGNFTIKWLVRFLGLLSKCIFRDRFNLGILLLHLGILLI